MGPYGRSREEHFSMEANDTTLQTDDQQPEEQSDPKGASWFSSAFILSGPILGAGIFNSPQAYVLAGGIYHAIITQLICAIFIFIGMVFVAHCSQITGKKTLQDLVFHYCGHTGLFVANFCIIAELGVCITYLIAIADQVDHVMSAVFGHYFCNYWYLDRNFTLPVISMLLIYPPCLIKNIHNLNVISYIGMLTVIYLVFFVFWEYFHGLEKMTSETRVSLKDGYWMDVFKIAPTLMFSYQVNIEAVPLFQSMKNPRLYDFTKAIALSIIMTSCVFIIMGTLGVLTIGSAVASDIFTDYNTSDDFVKCAMLMVVLKIITTYPIVQYGVRLVLDDIIVYVSQDRWTESKRRFLSSSVLFSLSLLIAILVPSIGGVISSVGIAETLLCLIFPGIAFFKEYIIWNSWWDAMRCLGGALLTVIGALIFGVGFVQVVQLSNAGHFSHRDVVCDLWD